MLKHILLLQTCSDMLEALQNYVLLHQAYSASANMLKLKYKPSTFARLMIKLIVIKGMFDLVV